MTIRSGLSSALNRRRNLHKTLARRVLITRRTRGRQTDRDRSRRSLKANRNRMRNLGRRRRTIRIRRPLDQILPPTPTKRITAQTPRIPPRRTTIILRPIRPARRIPIKRIKIRTRTATTPRIRRLTSPRINLIRRQIRPQVSQRRSRRETSADTLRLTRVSSDLRASAQIDTMKTTEGLFGYIFL